MLLTGQENRGAETIYVRKRSVDIKLEANKDG